MEGPIVLHCLSYYNSGNDIPSQMYCDCLKNGQLKKYNSWLAVWCNVANPCLMKSQYGCKNHVVFILGTFYVCHVIFFKRQISVIIFLLEMQQNGSSNSKIQEKLDPFLKYNFSDNRLCWDIIVPPIEKKTSERLNRHCVVSCWPTYIQHVQRLWFLLNTGQVAAQPAPLY